MNPVLILTHNNLELTKRCVHSVLHQDIEVSPCLVDNGSSDGTTNWAHGYLLYEFGFNAGVSSGWNRGLNRLFSSGFDHVLVVGNDTVLGKYTYSALLEANVPFVTGVDVGMSPLPDKPDVFPLSPHPDFSCFLIRRECWEKVGAFDETMVSYAGDCDYHVRAHRLGIPLYKASVPYNHERSSTIANASNEEKLVLHAQANRDREAFKKKWGCLPGTLAYEELFRGKEANAKT